MKEPQNNKQTIEDQLANFTDHILCEETIKEDGSSLSPDLELRALEQTAQRLKNAFSEEGPSEAVVQRMRQNIAMQWRQQEIKESTPFWKKWMSMFQPSKQKWQSQRSQLRLSMAFTLAILIALMLVSAPLLKGVNPDQTAATGQNLRFGLLVASGGLILLMIWFFRRKQ